MPVPRRLIVVAASALAAGAALYVRNKLREQKEHAAARDRVEPQGAHGAGPTGSSAPSTGAASKSEAPAGSMRELSQFLAGESWYDEVGWQGIWEREGIEHPETWLRTKGRNVLATERTKLTEHPALLAGCRRRWIVVCRYAGIDVADAASLWSATETAAA